MWFYVWVLGTEETTFKAEWHRLKWPSATRPPSATFVWAEAGLETHGSSDWNRNTWKHGCTNCFTTWFSWCGNWIQLKGTRNENTHIHVLHILVYFAYIYIYMLYIHICTADYLTKQSKYRWYIDGIIQMYIRQTTNFTSWMKRFYQGPRSFSRFRTLTVEIRDTLRDKIRETWENDLWREICDMRNYQENGIN